MRVIITGMTKQHVGEGTQLGYEPVADIVAKGFRLLQHDVEHRRLTIGEDLSSYDLIVVGMVPLLSIATNHLHAALWALHEAEHRGIPVAFFVDDWQFTTIMTKLGTVSRGAYHLTKPFFAGRPNHEWALAHVDEEMGVVNRLLNEDWPPTVIPAFTWGNHAVLRSRLPRAPYIRVLDPSILARDYEVAVPAERKRRWVLGTVSDQREWLEKVRGDWPVAHIGGRASKADTRLSEAELVQLYAESRGVLSPPYSAVLRTGWWRNRFVYAARTRSILLCDPREAPQLGGAYDGTIERHTIELMTDGELDKLADWQFQELTGTFMPHDEIAETLSDVISMAVQRVAS